MREREWEEGENTDTRKRKSLEEPVKGSKGRVERGQRGEGGRESQGRSSIGLLGEYQTRKGGGGCIAAAAAAGRGGARGDG